MTQTDSGTGLALLVNGAERTAPVGSTLADLLHSLDLDPRLVVVEHNGVILRDRTSYDRQPLDGGDVLELVHFVGGG
jgi:thiamine biosynthesis protein ThiS